MKRLLAAVAIAAALGGTAFAQTMAAWSDPANTFSIRRPAAWPVDRMSGSSEAVNVYAAGLADAECTLYSIDRPNTAGRSVQSIVSGFSQAMTVEQWTQVAGSIRTFRAGAEVQTPSVDTSGFWPVQRATIVTDGTPVASAIHARPGREIWVFCQSYDSRDRTSIFNEIIASVATPRDAELQASAAAAATEPAPAPAPAPQ